MSLLSTPGSDYSIHTDIYNGPLDLLLELITNEELEITRLSLAKVTDQYLAYLEKIQQTSAIEVSGFLVVAAKLIQIKSESLLPRPPERIEGEEDPAAALAYQLKVYKAFKEAANWLQALEDEGQHTYIRLAPPPKVSEDLDLDGIGISTLVDLLKTLYHYEEEAAPITTVVTIPRRTIKTKMQDLINRLREGGRISYRDMLMGKHDRIDAIVLFLAILELIKQQYVIADQKDLFSNIQIDPTEKTYQNDELTLALEE